MRNNGRYIDTEIFVSGNVCPYWDAISVKEKWDNLVGIKMVTNMRWSYTWRGDINYRIFLHAERAQEIVSLEGQNNCRNINCLAYCDSIHTMFSVPK
jgi:hypothetical protein